MDRRPPRFAASAVLLAAVMSLQQAGTSGQSPEPRFNGPSSQTLHQILNDYWEWRLANEPELATRVGRREHNARWRDWSKAARFDAAVRAIVDTPAEARITVKARIEGNTVTVESNAVAYRSARDPRLVLALVESGLSVAVQAGENRGETLLNDRVVRAWSGPLALTPAPLQWTLPMSPEQRYAVVAFVQESPPNGRLLQALDLPLSGC